MRILRDGSAAKRNSSRHEAGGEADARAWLALGNTRAQSNRWSAAIEAYREVLAREPEWPDAHYNLGRLLKQQGELAGPACLSCRLGC
jgi:tetratricopeptide (TPR) repeat protein